MEEENKTNIQRADEIAGYFDKIGLIPFKTPYIGFLVSNPSLITSLGVLVDNQKNGTVSGQDYTHAILSLGGVALGTAELVALGITGATLGLPAFGIALGIAVLDYLNSEYYDDVANYVEEITSQYYDAAANYEEEITSHLNGLLEELSKQYPHLTQSEREGLAYQIASGNNSGVSYAAYNAGTARYDPLILDLNGDGVKTISQQTSKTFFDLSGDGMSEQTGWVDSNDGLLVYDKNGNGKIDDISELFGNANQSGFSELKQLFDANNDNLIDDKDINFSQLKVWQDINSDGISQENELKTLNELGISNINLGSTSTSIDSNGNTIKATSTFTQNGEIKQIADVDFTSSKMLTPSCPVNEFLIGFVSVAGISS